MPKSKLPASSAIQRRLRRVIVSLRGAGEAVDLRGWIGVHRFKPRAVLHQFLERADRGLMQVTPEIVFCDEYVIDVLLAPELAQPRDVTRHRRRILSVNQSRQQRD